MSDRESESENEKIEKNSRSSKHNKRSSSSSKRESSKHKKSKNEKINEDAEMEESAAVDPGSVEQENVVAAAGDGAVSPPSAAPVLADSPPTHAVKPNNAFLLAMGKQLNAYTSDPKNTTYVPPPPATSSESGDNFPHIECLVVGKRDQTGGKLLLSLVPVNFHVNGSPFCYAPMLQNGKIDVSNTFLQASEKGGQPEIDMMYEIDPGRPRPKPGTSERKPRRYAPELMFMKLPGWFYLTWSPGQKPEEKISPKLGDVVLLESVEPELSAKDKKLYLNQKSVTIKTPIDSRDAAPHKINGYILNQLAYGQYANQLNTDTYLETTGGLACKLLPNEQDPPGLKTVRAELHDVAVAACKSISDKLKKNVSKLEKKLPGDKYYAWFPTLPNRDELMQSMTKLANDLANAPPGTPPGSILPLRTIRDDKGPQYPLLYMGGRESMQKKHGLEMPALPDRTAALLDPECGPAPPSMFVDYEKFGADMMRQRESNDYIVKSNLIARVVTNSSLAAECLKKPLPNGELDNTAILRRTSLYNGVDGQNDVASHKYLCKASNLARMLGITCMTHLEAFLPALLDDCDHLMLRAGAAPVDDPMSELEENWTNGFILDAHVGLKRNAIHVSEEWMKKALNASDGTFIRASSCNASGANGERIVVPKFSNFDHSFRGCGLLNLGEVEEISTRALKRAAEETGDNAALKYAVLIHPDLIRPADKVKMWGSWTDAATGDAFMNEILAGASFYELFDGARAIPYAIIADAD